MSSKNCLTVKGLCGSCLPEFVDCIKSVRGGGPGPQTDKHLAQSPFAGHFQDDILHCDFFGRGN